MVDANPKNNMVYKENYIINVTKKNESKENSP